MTFLNPLLLVGLVAAAIPIIIHLLNLRKLKTIEFSTLRFLKELQRTKMRRLKVRQILLLILRTLLVIALVIAFARPALRGSFAGTIGTHARTTVIVLLDDSPSMSVRNERGMVFAQAREAARSILDVVREGDEVYLIRLSEIRRRETFPPAYSVEAVRSAIDGMTVAMESTPYHEALAVAARILAESRNFNQEVYLVTDAQATQFAVGGADTSALFSDRVKFFVMDAGGAEVANTAITAVKQKSRIMSIRRPAYFEATVANYGPAPVRNLVMSVYMQGTRVMQQTVDLGPWATAQLPFSIVPTKSGFHHAYVQSEDDALEADNRRHVVVSVPEFINVLLVGPRSHTRYPSLALTLASDTGTVSMFRVKEIPPDRLSVTDINAHDVIIACGVPAFSVGDAERLGAFVQTGGGLIVFPGDQTDLPNYNSGLFARLAIPAAQPPPVRSPQPEEDESHVSFGRVDFAHPLFAGMFDQPASGRQSVPAIESPRILRSITAVPGKTGQSVVTLSDGSSFLTEYQAGTGKVLLYSVEAGLTWSDFAVKGLFAPLIYRSVVYVGTQGDAADDVVVGEPIRVTTRSRGTGERDAFVLRSPSGIDERIIPRHQVASALLQFESSPTTEPGVYEIKREADGKTIGAIPVNLSSAESDLRRADTGSLEMFWSRMGVSRDVVQILNASDRLETKILESRFGVELWKYFIGLALLCALLEMIIGRTSKAESAS
jgi:hypothetical protein